MKQHGFALITVLIVLAVLMVLLTAHFLTTSIELATTRATTDSVTGFYAAEAGLNVRGELIRAVFQGYNRPAGASPAAADPCQVGNLGSGNFACQNFSINNRTVVTYVVEDPRNNDPNDSARMLTIPPGERFAGLNAIQYRYSVFSKALPPNDDRPEAILEMVFRSRLVPLFQFAAFYNKDLEILPGPDMTLNGRVHTNGDLYLNSNATLSITGDITVSERPGGTGGTLFRGRKDGQINPICAGFVRVDDGNPATPDPAIDCDGRRAVPQSELDAWNGRIETGLETLTVPPQETFDIAGFYWREADLRVALDLRAGLANARVIVPNREVLGGVVTENVALTSTLNSCLAATQPAQRYYSIRSSHPGLVGRLPALSTTAVRAVEYSNSLRNHRQNATDNQRTSHTLMLEVDTRALLNCLHQHRTVLFNDSPSVERRLDDTSGGGLVWYFTVLGPHANDAASGYGARLRNSSRLSATVPGAPAINGLTVVSDQAIYLQGDFNLDGPQRGHWRPAAVMADTVHILSNNWSKTAEEWVGGGWGANRRASATTVNAAFLAATNSTGGQEGTGGQGGAYSGGLENYPWFHENWDSIPFNYQGSFVSLERPCRWGAQWSWPNTPTGTGSPRYEAPTRNWGYDTRFNNVANLPPLSPRFVYLIQERFVRDFSR
ncbi:MAG: pilus assembly PilX N-terminal domain-containing protein [Truepera sp.]|nr:pilus assembly PilX N-terminal domain-containing protein [Truepera sp.]